MVNHSSVQDILQFSILLQTCFLTIIPIIQLLDCSIKKWVVLGPVVLNLLLMYAGVLQLDPSGVLVVCFDAAIQLAPDLILRLNQDLLQTNNRSFRLFSCLVFLASLSAVAQGGLLHYTTNHINHTYMGDRSSSTASDLFSSSSGRDTTRAICSSKSVDPLWHVSAGDVALEAFCTIFQHRCILLYHRVDCMCSH